MATKRAFVLFELMNAMLLTAREAKARGLHVVALNHDPLRDSGPFAVPEGLVDELVPVTSWSDDAEVGALVKDLAQRYDVVGTHSVFEATLPHQAALRELAGLPTTSEPAMRRLLDKGWVRSTLRAEGLSSLRSVSLDEALSWDRWEFDRPAIVKPANGTGSALCFEVSTPEQLRAVAERVAEADVVNPLMREYILAHGGFVVEEKAEGELLSVESVVDRGRVEVIGLTGRYVLAADPVVEQGLFFPYRHPRQEAIAAKAVALHEALGFHHGVSHLEVMVADDGAIELIDFNPRGCGFAAPVFTGAAYGIDFAAVLTDVACGITPDLAPFAAPPPRYAVEMVVLPPPGATRFHEIEFPPEAIAGRAMKGPGQQLTGRSDQLDAIGMFIVVGDSPAGAHRAALRARREVVFNGEPLGDNENNRLAHSPHIGTDFDWTTP